MPGVCCEVYVSFSFVQKFGCGFAKKKNWVDAVSDVVKLLHIAIFYNEFWKYSFPHSISYIVEYVAMLHYYAALQHIQQ